MACRPMTFWGCFGPHQQCSDGSLHRVNVTIGVLFISGISSDLLHLQPDKKQTSLHDSCVLHALRATRTPACGGGGRAGVGGHRGPAAG